VFALEADPQNDAPGEWGDVFDFIGNPLSDTPFNGPLYYHIGGTATNEIVVDKSKVIGFYPKFLYYTQLVTLPFSSIAHSIYATSSTSGIGMHFQ